MKIGILVEKKSKFKIFSDRGIINHFRQTKSTKVAKIKQSSYTSHLNQNRSIKIINKCSI
jgi:hypothetical protein